MSLGTGKMESQAREGLKLFAADEALEADEEAATTFKAQVDEHLAALEAEVAKLTGKDNKKDRAAKGKEIAEIKADPKYIDACKVVRGLQPKHGFFVKHPPGEHTTSSVPDAKREPRPRVEDTERGPDITKEKDKDKVKDVAKKTKKEESAGLSSAEMRELEQLKEDIMHRKEELKGEGLSGSQQNKDSQVIAWVARMNELKEKADPGSTKKDAKKPEGKKTRVSLSTEEQRELEKLKGGIDEYKHRLKVEFGYSNKDIKTDPELMEMEARLAALEKREA